MAVQRLDWVRKYDKNIELVNARNEVVALAIASIEQLRTLSVSFSDESSAAALRELIKARPDLSVSAMLPNGRPQTSTS
jgi:hypothetical protein